MHIVPGVIVDYSPGPGTPTPVANSVKKLYLVQSACQQSGERATDDLSLARPLVNSGTAQQYNGWRAERAKWKQKSANVPFLDFFWLSTSDWASISLQDPLKGQWFGKPDKTQWSGQNDLAVSYANDLAVAYVFTPGWLHAGRITLISQGSHLRFK